MPAEAARQSYFPDFGPTPDSSLPVADEAIKLRLVADGRIWNISFYPLSDNEVSQLPKVEDYDWLSSELEDREIITTSEPCTELHDKVVDFFYNHWGTLHHIFEKEESSLTSPSCAKEVDLEDEHFQSGSYPKGSLPDLIGIGTDGVVKIIEVKSKKRAKVNKDKQVKNSGTIFDSRFRDRFGDPFPTALYSVAYQQRGKTIHLRIMQVEKAVERTLTSVQ